MQETIQKHLINAENTTFAYCIRNVYQIDLADTEKRIALFHYANLFRGV